MGRASRSGRLPLRLPCSLCDYLIEADEAGALLAVMMAHDAEGHAERYAGKTLGEVQELRGATEEEIRKAIRGLQPKRS